MHVCVCVHASARVRTSWRVYGMQCVPRSVSLSLSVSVSVSVSRAMAVPVSVSVSVSV